jgi:hypothetical protein
MRSLEGLVQLALFPLRRTRHYGVWGAGLAWSDGMCDLIVR